MFFGVVFLFFSGVGSFKNKASHLSDIQPSSTLNLPVVREIAVIVVQNLANLINECWKSCLLTSRLHVPKIPPRPEGKE